MDERTKQGEPELDETVLISPEELSVLLDVKNHPPTEEVPVVDLIDLNRQLALDRANKDWREKKKTKSPVIDFT
jgi:hypothetical protein